MNLFPTLNLTGAMGANVSASLMAPIFDGGWLKRERDLAARKQELVQVYRATVIAAKT